VVVSRLLREAEDRRLLQINNIPIAGPMMTVDGRGNLGGPYTEMRLLLMGRDVVEEEEMGEGRWSWEEEDLKLKKVLNCGREQCFMRWAVGAAVASLEGRRSWSKEREGGRRRRDGMEKNGMKTKHDGEEWG
jgi:hypothetical protein